LQVRLLEDGGLGVIEVAFNRIVDEHVTPVDEAALLGAAWDGVQTAARSRNLPEPTPPSFTGDRAIDIDRFRRAWFSLPEELAFYPPTRWTAIRSMARSVNDCHTYFLGPALPNSNKDPQNRALSGFGMTLTGKPPVVAEIETEPYSPAAVARLQPGDSLLSIDGQDTTSMGPLDVLILLDGHEEGENVDIRLHRPGQFEPVTVTLNLAEYSPQNLQAKVLDGGIGYIRLHDWEDSRVTSQLLTAFARFDKSKVKKWIIDLRGNPGGLVTADAISLFLPEGVAIRARRRDGIIEEDPASGYVLANLKPLDLLVDDGSASMSEIFALALQEHHAARLVGTKTYGCIGETFIDDIGDGSGLAVTFETMLGPVTGAELNGVGITPDEIVPRSVDDLVAGRDPQLDAAIADLNTQ
jgi:carboxyl-terminal processing protease